MQTNPGQLTLLYQAVQMPSTEPHGMMEKMSKLLPHAVQKHKMMHENASEKLMESLEPVSQGQSVLHNMDAQNDDMHAHFARWKQDLAASAASFRP